MILINVYVIYLGGSTLSGLIVADSWEEAFDEYSRKCGFKDRLEFTKYYQGKLGWSLGTVEEGVSANQKTDICFLIMTKKIKNNGKYEVVCDSCTYEDRFGPNGLDGLVSIYKYIGITTLPNDLDNQLTRAIAEEVKLYTTMPPIVRSTVEEIKLYEQYIQDKEEALQ